MAYPEKEIKHLKNRKASKRGVQINKQHNDNNVATLLSIHRSKNMVSHVLAADTKAEIKLYLQP
jgi:hypothetical protein